MNRRQFLTRALAAVPVVAAPAAILEAFDGLIELPDPARRVIFLPPLNGWIYEHDPMEITRKFIPRMVVQIYDSSPLMSVLMRNRSQ